MAFYIGAYFLIFSTILPYFPCQHWLFRLWEFGKIQQLFLQLLFLLIGFFIPPPFHWFYIVTEGLLAAGLISNMCILAPYTPLAKNTGVEVQKQGSSSISLLSVNVYQFNKDYSKLLKVIAETNPDIILTMESNHDWEKALQVLDSAYPYFKKVPLENTYGMHFYSKLKVLRLQVNYFVANDMPSIEADLLSNEDVVFTVFGVHPAPPSPTQEPNSKQRDGELLALAKKVKKLNRPSIVVGDFNNVAWAKSSVLFRKTSELLDPRIGRGFVSTYHAKYLLLRFPIDLFFHSPQIFVEDFKTLEAIGSDHLPLYSRFFIKPNCPAQEEEVEQLEAEEMVEVKEMIRDGRLEKSDRPAVAEE